VQHRDEFRERIERHPQPEHVRSLPEMGPEFVQLEVWEGEVLDPVLM
jgi:hypothetical protein